MYFDIYINDEKVVTVGPSNLEELRISLSSHTGDVWLTANGLTVREDGDMYLTWLEQELEEPDSIRIVPSRESFASEPLKSRDLRRNQKAAEENRFCDFCKRGEEEAGRLIQAGETPFICVQCAELCIEIANDWENED